jgi:galactoside O-acetyltransferase
MSFYSNDELKKMGFKYLGENVKLSRLSSIYGHENIEIGNNSRIDDFCVISASNNGIEIGSYVHIAAYSSIQGKGKVVLEDFSGLSSRVAIYSSTDDYSGDFMTNPTVPAKYINVISGNITLKKHVIIGVGSAIMPNVEIGIGSAIGAFSLVTKNIPEHSIAVGVPAKFIKTRRNNLLELEKELKNKSS